MDLPGEFTIGNSWDSLSRFTRAGFDVVAVTLAGDNHSSAQALKLVAWARAELRKRADSLKLIRTLADVDAAREAGKLGIVLQFEGTRCFERNLDLIDAFYHLGVRQTLIAFNNANSAGGGCAELVDGGLTGFGRRLVGEMERVGMLVDLSHTGYRTSMDVLEMATKPAVFSHSNVHSLRPVFRNLRDDQIRACAKTGGTIGISGSSEYLGDVECATSTVFRHVDYVAQLVGPSHVSLGLDLVFEPELLTDWARARPETWPMTLDADWPGFRYAKPEQICDLTEQMLRSGYDDAAIRGILGDNLRRVCQIVWVTNE